VIKFVSHLCYHAVLGGITACLRVSTTAPTAVFPFSHYICSRTNRIRSGAIIATKLTQAHGPVLPATGETWSDLRNQSPNRRSPPIQLNQKLYPSYLLSGSRLPLPHSLSLASRMVQPGFMRYGRENGPEVFARKPHMYYV
jgi:hypothetical protein